MLPAISVCMLQQPACHQRQQPTPTPRLRFCPVLSQSSKCRPLKETTPGYSTSALDLPLIFCCSTFATMATSCALFLTVYQLCSVALLATTTTNTLAPTVSLLRFLWPVRSAEASGHKSCIAF